MWEWLSCDNSFSFPRLLLRLLDTHLARIHPLPPSSHSHRGTSSTKKVPLAHTAKGPIIFIAIQTLSGKENSEVPKVFSHFYLPIYLVE